jgi:hypothetical protein
MRILWLVVTLHFGAPLGSLIVPNKHSCEASRLSNWLTLTDYKKNRGFHALVPRQLSVRAEGCQKSARFEMSRKLLRSRQQREALESLR